MTTAVHNPSNYRVLLAARGNPDFRQDPAQVSHGVDQDKIRRVGSMMEAVVAVTTFIRDHELGGGNWVGGDVWEGGLHQGRIAYNGTFFANEQGSLVRNGQFVFGAHSNEQATSVEARLAEVVRQLLRDPMTASWNVAAFQAGKAALAAYDDSQLYPTIDLDQELWKSIKNAAGESSWMPKEYFANDWVSDLCDYLRNGLTTTSSLSKPLDWIAAPSGQLFYADGFQGYRYQVNENLAGDEILLMGILYGSDGPEDVIDVIEQKHGSFDEAKQAAQDHQDAKVMEWLHPDLLQMAIPAERITALQALIDDNPVASMAP